MGDLNAKHTAWRCSTSNNYGKKLLQYIEQNDINVLAPTDPTFFGGNTKFPNILDVALIKNLARTTNIKTLTELSSDHNPIILEIGILNLAENIYTRTKTDWDKYKKYLTENLRLQCDIKTTEHIEDACHSFTKTITDAVKHATASLESKENNTNNLPKRIKELINVKNKLKRKAQRTLNPTDKLEANRMVNTIKEEIRTFRAEKWHDKIKSLNTTDGSLWKLTKSLKKKSNIVPPINGPRGMAFSGKDKAEVFAVCLEEQFTPHTFDDDDLDEELEAEVYNTIQYIKNSPAQPPTSSHQQNK